MTTNISRFVHLYWVASLGVLLMFAFSQLEKRIPHILAGLSIEPFSFTFNILASLPFLLWIFIPVLLFLLIRKKSFSEIKKQLSEAVIAIVVVDFILIPLTIWLVTKEGIPITIGWIVQIFLIHTFKDFLLWISYRLALHFSQSKNK